MVIDEGTAVFEDKESLLDEEKRSAPSLKRIFESVNKKRKRYDESDDEN